MFYNKVRCIQPRGKPMRSTAVISSKGQIVIPANLRKRYCLREFPLEASLEEERRAERKREDER